MFNSRRVLFATILGAILGIICILGATLRSGGSLSNVYLFAFWYNRLLMGIVIGLFIESKSNKVLLLRGAIIGIMVSFAFYSSTNYADWIGFVVGAFYGIIIEFGAKYFTDKFPKGDNI